MQRMSFFEERARLLQMSTETDQLKYEKASDHLSAEAGGRYEECTLALVFLRSLREGLQFILSSNDAAADKFDDVVLCWNDEEDSTVSALFGQLKYKTSAKRTTISRSSLMGNKKDFSLRTYRDSYVKIRDSLDGGSYALVLSTNIDLDDDAQKRFENNEGQD
ncbi:uncharacterized protein LOC126209969 [Schistocerca nitens]|uniref:uncharacterized protein LOC126209969 n=1 Tax=Schistocerca nitens TaxID=7011 RepID=UPI0021182944|nr:uncharacterized protein LOC126209969 [Schistocerca nitens]